MHSQGHVSLLENAVYRIQQAVRPAAFAAVAVIFVFVASMTLPAAQKNSKKDKQAQPVPPIQQIQQPDAPGAVPVVLPLADGQAIELMVAQMLGAWQIGDDQLLHTFYADDVLVVSGGWEPALQGWPTYLRAYQAQRAHTQGVRLDRTNTFTKVLGTTAWCTYQWQFTGQVDGTPVNAFGQTTLVLEKRAGKWLIAVNHTSSSPAPQRAVSSSAAPATQTLQPVSSPR